MAPFKYCGTEVPSDGKCKEDKHRINLKLFKVKHRIRQTTVSYTHLDVYKRQS